MTASCYTPYPWQESHWQSLIERHRNQRLPHAMLFTGPAGLGKVAMARGFAKSLLCDRPDEKGCACGGCRSCQLFDSGSHPDYLMVEPEEEGKAIGVDAIRGLSSSQSLKSQYGPNKLILLTPADQLNANASNALLKTLEEPTAGTILILVTDRPMSLLPTIRSRCQNIEFRPAPIETAAPWLQKQLSADDDARQLLAMVSGSPLTALDWAQSGVLEQRQAFFEQLEGIRQGRNTPLDVAEQWKDADMVLGLGWLYSCLADMIRIKSTTTDKNLNNPDLAGPLAEWAERVDINFLYRILDKVTETSRLITGQINRQLMMEDLLLSWNQAFRR